MARNRKSAKDAGAAFEQKTADYLAKHVDDRIERRNKNGVKDRGDISSLRTPHGGRVVVQCKEYGGEIKAAVWTAAAEVQRGNDDALVGLVVAKRRGTTDPGSQWVLMELRELVALLTGERPDHDRLE